MLDFGFSHFSKGLMQLLTTVDAVINLKVEDVQQNIAGALIRDHELYNSVGNFFSTRIHGVYSIHFNKKETSIKASYSLTELTALLPCNHCIRGLSNLNDICLQEFLLNLGYFTVKWSSFLPNRQKFDQLYFSGLQPYAIYSDIYDLFLLSPNGLQPSSYLPTC